MSRLYLNEEWKFATEFKEEMLQREYQLPMETVRIPHTVKELPFHYFDEHLYQMNAAYRKVFCPDNAWKGKSVVLTVDGAAHTSVVYLNGKVIGTHNCGYTAFQMDITEEILWGEENVLIISVNSNENQNIPPFGFVVDYMTFGGIYRDVYFDIREKEYVKDVFARSDFSQDMSEITLRSDVTLSTISEEKAYLVKQYLKPHKQETEAVILLGENICKKLTDTLTYQVSNVKLWDIDQPNLYDLYTELWEDGALKDTRVDVIGFRKAEFRADGFYLNNSKTKIRGLNRHQSYPYVGYAMPESMQRMDADILKNELACNAVRTSHYPQSHYFINQCDEIGLLVFTEIPGWQHIGDAEWKNQAVDNVKDMILEYRNHPSIILWGVRINESPDDDEFYKRTNEVAHRYDDSRQTGGVRCIKNSHLFEDVYTYNDFSHDGKQPGCEPKNKVTSDQSKAYLISEYNGHMYPTKNFDWEGHRVEHALRHARVLDEVKANTDIAGSFGWCMFDYNTHKDFGSGDRICYHGVMDMFRNPKLASLIYACEEEKTPVLELSSSMDIGEHPACNRGFTYIISNADSVKMYKNDVFIKEYTNADSPFKNLKHGPMIIDDFIGNQIHEQEDFKKGQADGIKYALNYTATHGYGKYPAKVIGIALKCMLIYHMNPNEAVKLYNKYIGDWGGTSTVYRFEAIKDGKVVKTLVKEPMKTYHLQVQANTDTLIEKSSYDVAAIRMKVCDENHNQLSFFQEVVEVTTEGPIEVIGPKNVALRGGMAGTYIRTTGKSGEAKVHFKCAGTEDVTINLTVKGNLN